MVVAPTVYTTVRSLMPLGDPFSFDHAAESEEHDCLLNVFASLHRRRAEF